MMPKTSANLVAKDGEQTGIAAERHLVEISNRLLQMSQ